MLAKHFLLLVFILGFARELVFAADPSPANANEYHLHPRDLVRFSVFNEPEMSVERRVDGIGMVALPLIGSVDFRGLTIGEAEEKVKSLYIRKEIFVSPQVSITVVEYVAKEVSVIGQVKTPGKIVFPIESDSLEIVDVISKAGGVTRIARPDSVRVTRKAIDGAELTFTVDVERMFDGRGGAKAFLVFPGDVIFVPERLL